MVKKISLFLFSLAILTPIIQAQEASGNFFYGDTCPHCHTVLGYFEENNTLDNYNITLREVWRDRQNAKLFVDQMATLNQPIGGSLPVPILIYESQVFSGSREIINFFEDKETPLTSQLETSSPKINDQSTKTEHTFWGFLPALSMAAIADAVNPCAFAVLILLLLGILTTNDRKRMLKAGLAFSLAIFISYLAMGFGLYSALATFSSTKVITTIAGTLAILLGIFNLKDAIWYGGGGWKMEVPEAWRSRMKILLAQITSPLGAFLIGFIISLFLLPCTSGPYIVILGLLSTEATFTCAAQCLAVYNFIFVLPMIGITLAVYYGLNPQHIEALRRKHLKNLHLIIGTLLILIGLWTFWG